MTADEYKSERQKRGTQEQVAALLGLTRSTIIRREKGRLPITTEAALSIQALPSSKPKQGSPTT